MRWVLRGEVGSPGARYGHSMAYDAERGVTYLFGGEYSEVGGDPVFFNDVWEYDGKLWRKIVTSGEPPTPRAYATIIPFKEIAGDGTPVYGFTVGRGIGFSSRDDDEFDVQSSGYRYHALGDGKGVWTVGGANNWFSRGSLGTGGVDVERVLIGEHNWYSVNNGGLPMGLADHQAMNVNRNAETVLLVLGGGYMRLIDNLEARDNPIFYTGPIIEMAKIGAGWQRLSTGLQPSPRFQHVGAYDSDRHRVVIYGGAGFTGGDLHWELNVPPQGPASYPAPDITWEQMSWPNMPGPRASAGMVYDSKRKVMVLVGGVGGYRYGDTWELVSTLSEITGLTQLETCLGTPATFRASVSGNGELRKQWHEHNLLQNGFVPMIGETNSVLSVNPVQTGMHLYRFEVQDGCDNLSRLDFGLYVHHEPEVTLEFQHQESCPGNAVTLTATVFSTLPVDFQWHHDGRPVSDLRTRAAGQWKDTLLLDNVTAESSGLYTVVAKNACRARTNDQFLITHPNGFFQTSGHLQVGPRIVQEPDSVTRNVCDPTPVVLTGKANGFGKLSYQWRLDGVPLINGGRFFGVDGPTLLIDSPITYTLAGDYDLIVSDQCLDSPRLLSVTSRVATLTVTPGQQWTFRTTNGPPARYHHAMAYDAIRKVTILFGGYFHSPTTFGSYNDLWEWNGAEWKKRIAQANGHGWTQDSNGHWQRFPTNRPVARAEHAMTYDPRRGRVVIFGGMATDPSGGQVPLNDTWEWDGAQWYFVGTNGPAWRTSAAMTYNHHHETAVLFGGAYSGDDPAFGAIWEWNGATWRTNASSGGPTRTVISAMAYDQYHDQTFFGPTLGFSGILSDIFWTLNGSNWTAKGEALNINELTLGFGDMVYDSYRRRTIYTFGTKGSTGLWDGRRWAVLTNAPAPPVRFGHATAYDSARHSTILFGGTFGFNKYYVNTNDTWELIAPDLPLITRQPASQYRVPNENAVFQVTVEAPPGATLSYRWFRDNSPLADRGHISGTATATLTVAAAQPADAGSYHVRIASACGEAISDPAILTLNPNLQIFSTVTTATLIWSAPNVVLEQADNPAGPWSPVPNAESPFQPAAVGPSKFFRLRPIQ